MTTGSRKFKLDCNDLHNLGRNAALVGVAAGLAYVAQNLGHIDFGTLGVLVVPVISTAIHSTITWLKDNTE